MAWSGTEYLATNADAGGFAASSTHIVSFNAQATFDVFDRSAHTALEYGVGYGGYFVGLDSIVYAGGSFWFVSGWSSGGFCGIQKINPTGWTVDPQIYGYGNAGPLVVVGDYVWGGAHRRQISTGTYTGGGSTGNALGVAGGRLFSLNGTTLSEINPTTGSVITTFTLPYAAAGPGRAATWGTSILFHRNNLSVPVVGFDTATDSPFAIAATPPLVTGTAPGSRWVAHDDGYIYALTASGTKMVVFDPATGRNFTDDLPTSRTGRSTLFSVGGSLWTASAQPDPWP